MRATTMPPTLGDRLGDVMWERKHTPDDVAALIDDERLEGISNEESPLKDSG